MRVSLKKSILPFISVTQHWSCFHPHQSFLKSTTRLNGQYTSDGGTHLSAFREGLLRGINDFANKNSRVMMREGVLGAIAIRLKEPVFESQTKNKLGNSEIRSDLVTRIAQSTAQALHRNITEAKKLIAKIEETQKLRKELNSVKKFARERSKAVSGTSTQRLQISL